MKFPPPKTQETEAHDRHEDRAKADHDVIREIQKRDEVGSLIGRKIGQAHNTCGPTPMSHKGEEIGDLDRIVQRHRLHVGLANQHHRGPVLGMEMAFHRRESDRLISVHLLCDEVARGDRRQHAGNEADHDGQRKRYDPRPERDHCEVSRSFPGTPSENWL